MKSLLFNILFAVGGAGAVILALSSWIGKVLADRIHAKTMARYNRELEGLKTQLEIELEHARNQLSERREFLSTVQNALSGGFLSAHERVLNSLDSLWARIIEMRNFAGAHLLIFQLLTAKECATLPMERLSKLLTDLSYKEFHGKLTELTQDVERTRPFVGEKIWQLYTLYVAFTLRLIYKLLEWKKRGRVFEWYKDFEGNDDTFVNSLRMAFTEEEINAFVSETPVGAPQRIIAMLEAKILAEMNQWIFGRQLVTISLDEQQRVAGILQQIQNPPNGTLNRPD